MKRLIAEMLLNSRSREERQQEGRWDAHLGSWSWCEEEVERSAVEGSVGF